MTMEKSTGKELPCIVSCAMDDELRVYLELERVYESGKPQLMCECYDESYRMVARSKPGFVRGSGKSFVLEMEPLGWWLPGNYHILLYKDNYPTAHFSFDCDYTATSTMVREALTPESAYYQLYRITHRCSQGKYFGGLPGCRAAKKQLLRYLSHHPFITACPHFVVSEEAPDFELLHHFFGILYPRNPFNTVSCADYGERVRRHEDVKEIIERFEKVSIVVIHDLYHLLSSDCESLASMALHHTSFMDSIVILYGTQEELDAVMNRYPMWKPYLHKENRWKMEGYAVTERVRILEKELERLHLWVSYPGRQYLWEQFNNRADEMKDWREPEIAKWVWERILNPHRQRVLAAGVSRRERPGVVDVTDLTEYVPV